MNDKFCDYFVYFYANLNPLIFIIFDLTNFPILLRHDKTDLLI
jgi:hypothetical protein